MPMRQLAGLLIGMMTFLGAGEIRIATAANVSYAITPLIKAFNAEYPDTKVNVVLGSSGKLTAQILHGAPFDLFLSADMKYPEALYEEGSAIGKPVIYAQGALALFSVKRQDFSRGMRLLKEKTVQKIAVANPRTAPYGKAAKEAMENAGIYDAVKEKLVFGESVSQTVSYAVTATDMGIIAKSALLGPQMSMYEKGKQWAEVNPSLYRPIDQGMVILNLGNTKHEVREFYDFMQGEKAKSILRDFGYRIP